MPSANRLSSVPANFCACPEILRPEIVLLLRTGTVEGKIRGVFVSGIVKDESGEVAARFTGRIEPEGSMTGTYTDRTGEVLVPGGGRTRRRAHPQIELHRTGSLSWKPKN
jgi:hypothetical protein